MRDHLFCQQKVVSQDRWSHDSDLGKVVSGKMSTAEKGFISVGGVPTYVIKLGQVPKEQRVVKLIIPGNPGAADFYEVFMESLYAASDRRIPVWCVSFIGHVTVPASMKTRTSKETSSLHGQIRHMVQFIREHLPPDTKLILIGHSIGCYIILQMLEELSSDRVLKCLLLFPAIENIQTTPQGRSYRPFLKHFWWIGAWSMHLLRVIPQWGKNALVNWYFGTGKCDQKAIEATVKLADPTIVRRIGQIGNDMQLIGEADHGVIEKHLSKLMFYYGETDGWCPVAFYEEMKSKYPKGDVFLDQEGFEHAFVLYSGSEMAQWLWTWLVKNAPEVILRSP